jgi:signal transduction histidine kinase
MVATDRGKVLMDEARAFFARIIREADTRVAEGVAEQRWNAAVFRWVSIVGAMIIVIVVGGSAVAVWRYTREIVAAREAMDALNAGLEARVEERTADLTLANEEIQRFAYIVTHDLRAPLVNIMGFTSELEASVAHVREAFEAPVLADGGEGAPPDPVMADARRAVLEDLPEAIGFIRSSTKRMDGLINAILKLSREGRRVLKPERIELGELLKRTTDAVQHQLAEANGEVALDLNVPTIQSDRLSLEQIFGNLLDNAVKYRAKDRPLRIVIKGRTAPENRVLVDIEDNGRGIAPQDLERVFELFRRSGSQDQPGEGIGLAYVRTLARSLGGNVTVKSELGKGTIFSVRIPRSLPQNAGSASK